MEYIIKWKEIGNSSIYTEYGDSIKVSVVLSYLDLFWTKYELVSITPAE